MLVHPIFKLAFSQPQLLGEHLAAYGALASDELKKVSRDWSLRIGMYVGAGILSLIGLVWVGVAVLLAAATPSEDHHAGWLLWLVPMTPFVVAVVLVLVARAKKMEQPFSVLSGQLKADMAVIHEASSK